MRYQNQKKGEGNKYDIKLLLSNDSSDDEISYEEDELRLRLEKEIDLLLADDPSIEQIPEKEKVIKSSGAVNFTQEIFSSLGAVNGDSMSEKSSDDGIVTIKKKKKQKKKKSNPSPNDKEFNLEILKAEFKNSVEECFSIDGRLIEIKKAFKQLSYVVKIEIFDKVKSDFDDSEKELKQIPELYKRINQIYQLIELDLLTFIEEEINEVSIEEINLNIRTRIFALIKSAINQDMVTADNVFKWFDNVCDKCSFSDDQCEIIISYLLHDKKITPCNIPLWNQGLLKVNNKKFQSLTSKFIKVGINVGVIDIKNIDEWFDAISLCNSFGASEVATQVVHGLRASKEALISDIEKWANKIINKSNLAEEFVRQLFIQSYCPNYNNRAKETKSYKSLLITIAVNQVVSKGYHHQIITLVNDIKYSEIINKVIVQYLEDEKVSLENIAEKFADFPKMLAVIKTASDYISITYGPGIIQNDAEVYLATILSRLPLSNKKIMLQNIMSSYIFKTDRVNSTYQKIKSFSTLIHLLITDKKVEEEYLYKQTLLQTAYHAINQNIITVVNFGDWFDLIKENNFDYNFYADLYYSIADAIVSKKKELIISDLELWQNKLEQKFYSNQTVRDKIDCYSGKSLAIKKIGSDDRGNRRKLLANGFLRKNNFVINVATIMCSQSDKSELFKHNNFYESLDIIIKELDIRLFLLPLRVEQIANYLQANKSLLHREQTGISDSLAVQIDRFLDSKEKLSIIQIMDMFKATKGDMLLSAVKNQLDRGFEEGLHEDFFFKLLRKLDFAYSVYDVFRVDIDKSELAINHLMVKYANMYGIITPDKSSIVKFSQELGKDYHFIIDSFFRFCFCEKNFRLNNLIKWIYLFDDLLPDEYSTSQIKSFYKDDRDCNMYYILNICLESHIFVDEVMERNSKEKNIVRDITQFKIILTHLLITEEQSKTFLKLDNDKILMILKSIWEDPDLTKENISEIFDNTIFDFGIRAEKVKDELEELKIKTWSLL